MTALTPRTARFRTLLLAVAALVLQLALARDADAIEVSKPPDVLHSDVTELIVNRENCQAGASDYFEWGFSGATVGHPISVWGSTTGAECQLSANRAGTPPPCVQLRDDQAVSDVSVTVRVTATEIASAVESIIGCDDSTTGDSPHTVTIYFLVDASAGDVVDYHFEPVQVDFVGPPAPTSVTAGVFDETRLVVEYSAPSGTTDVDGYRAFCVAVGTTTSGSGGALPDGVGGFLGAAGNGGLGGTAAGGSAGSGGSAGAAAGGAAAGGAGTGGSTSSGTGGSTSSGAGGSGGSVASGDCNADELTPGEIPSLAYECGSVDGNTLSITTSALSMGTIYAIGVAANDKVDNLGKLSALVCASPEGVIDFFDAYTAAGGQAGGGICQCALVGGPADAAGALAAAAALALALSRRRARRGRGKDEA